MGLLLVVVVVDAVVVVESCCYYDCYNNSSSLSSKRIRLVDVVDDENVDDDFKKFLLVEFLVESSMDSLKSNDIFVTPHANFSHLSHHIDAIIIINNK
jgi:hypothetical protein